jgi:hypothetical protein
MKGGSVKPGALKRAAQFCWVILFLLGLTGCAVLTSSQVREVGNFSKATKEFITLPAALPKTYGILLRDNVLLAVSRHEYGAPDDRRKVDTSRANQAWEDVKTAYNLETEFGEAGKRLDGALEVLRLYAEILSALVSDQSGAALEESAVHLGNSLDAATEAYNREYRRDRPMKKAGTQVAEALRAMGGIYFRQKQIAVLRETVEDAAPLIEDLMAEIEDIASQQFKPAFINYEENYLGKEFRSVAISNRRVSVTTVMIVYEDLRRARRGAALADQIAQAARTYNLAHRSLVAKTRSRRDLKKAIEEIQTLKKEIDAARNVKEKMNQ